MITYEDFESRVLARANEFLFLIDNPTPDAVSACRKLAFFDVLFDLWDNTSERHRYIKRAREGFCRDVLLMTTEFPDEHAELMDVFAHNLKVMA